MLGTVTIKDDDPGDPTDEGAATRHDQQEQTSPDEPHTPAHPQALDLPTGALGIAESQTVAPELLADGEVLGEDESSVDAAHSAAPLDGEDDDVDAEAGNEPEDDAPTVTADGVELMGTQEFRALFVDEDAVTGTAVAEQDDDPEHPVEPPPPTDVVQTIARRRWTRGIILVVGLLLLLMLLGFAAAVVGNMFLGPGSTEDTGVSALPAAIAAVPWIE